MGQLCFHSISLPTHHCRGINLGSLDKNRTRFSEKYVFSPPYISGVPLMRAQFAFCDQLRPVGILASSFHPTAYNLERLRPRKRPTKTTKKMYIYIPRPRVQRHPAKKYCTVPNHCIPTYVKSLVPFQIII